MYKQGIEAIYFVYEPDDRIYVSIGRMLRQKKKVDLMIVSRYGDRVFHENALRFAYVLISEPIDTIPQITPRNSGC